MASACGGLEPEQTPLSVMILTGQPLLATNCSCEVGKALVVESMAHS